VETGVYLPDATPDGTVYGFWKKRPPCLDAEETDKTKIKIPRALGKPLTLYANFERLSLEGSAPAGARALEVRAVTELENLALSAEPVPGTLPWLIHDNGRWA
jgi:hypothetical protein